MAERLRLRPFNREVEKTVFGLVGSSGTDDEERGEGFKRWVFLTIGSREKGRRMQKGDPTVGDCKFEL